MQTQRHSTRLGPFALLAWTAACGQPVPDSAFDSAPPAATTHRVVIHTTDASFWDGPLVQPDGVAVEHGYAETVARLRNEEIRVFAFASDAVGPSIPGLPSCDAAAGWFAPYGAMPAIPDDTGDAALLIDDVRTGAVSLADTIPHVVEQSQCDPYPPAG